MTEDQQTEIPPESLGYLQAPKVVSDETIRWQLDPTDVLDEIKFYLKQYDKDNGGKWKPIFKDVTPLMSDEGINDLMGTLRGYVNKNLVLSNLNDKQIVEVMCDVCKTLRVFLVCKHKQYRIEKKNFDNIYHTIENHIYIFLLRALNNGERRHLRETHQFSEIKQSVEQREKKKFGVF